jgi:hypothetical protein
VTRVSQLGLQLSLRFQGRAADGQQPVTSSREHASASASSTRRSLPDVGEFALTQFMTAMLMPPGLLRDVADGCAPNGGRRQE